MNRYGTIWKVKVYLLSVLYLQYSNTIYHHKMMLEDIAHYRSTSIIHVIALHWEGFEYKNSWMKRCQSDEIFMTTNC